jgi:TctA family transporter
MEQSLTDLWYGFGVALQLHNLMWCVFGVLIGNLIGVLPGMGALTTISMLLPLTYVIAPVPAILVLAGIFYGSQYGGAIGAILLNLPSHPPHAVTCLDGYPMTKAGRGGAALGVTMMASFFAASIGIFVMIFLTPLLEKVAFQFSSTEISAIMLFGLLVGATMSRGSPLKGVAMTLFGLFCGVIGTDVTSGTIRYSLDFTELSDGVELGALCMGLFCIADFLEAIRRLMLACGTCAQRGRRSGSRSFRCSAALLSEHCSEPCRGRAQRSQPSLRMRWSIRSPRRLTGLEEGRSRA